jgi:hypothetical protein
MYMLVVSSLIFVPMESGKMICHVVIPVTLWQHEYCTISTLGTCNEQKY